MQLFIIFDLATKTGTGWRHKRLVEWIGYLRRKTRVVHGKKNESRSGNFIELEIRWVKELNGLDRRVEEKMAFVSVF